MITKEHIVLENGCEAYLFMPITLLQPASCIIVFHERYGLVQHTLDIGERMAEAGYVVLTPDLFSLWPGDKAALRRGEVRAIIADDDCASQLECWINHLKHRLAHEAKLNLILFGVCQSGRYPIVVASERDDLCACVILYGAAHDRDWASSDLQPRPMAKMISQTTIPMFFIFAERDHTISMDNVARLRGCLEAADISYRMRVIPDMPHGFLNDTMPGRYRPVEAQSVWGELLQFLGAVIRENWPHGKVEWDLHSVKSKTYDFTQNVRLE